MGKQHGPPRRDPQTLESDRPRGYGGAALTTPGPPHMGPISPLAPRLVRLVSAVHGRVPTADDWDVERALGSLGVDDQGEQLSWPLPALGVRFVLFREGEAVYVVRPWSGRFAESRGGRVEEGLLVEGRFVAPRTVRAPDGRLLWTIEVNEGPF